jgi:hypothetical protein
VRVAAAVCTPLHLSPVPSMIKTKLILSISLSIGAVRYMWTFKIFRRPFQFSATGILRVIFLANMPCEKVGL